ncbi:membrane hypothetical protein [Desulfovibrionales bacterium]
MPGQACLTALLLVYCCILAPVFVRAAEAEEYARFVGALSTTAFQGAVTTYFAVQALVNGLEKGIYNNDFALTLLIQYYLMVAQSTESLNALLATRILEDKDAFFFGQASMVGFNLIAALTALRGYLETDAKEYLAVYSVEHKKAWEIIGKLMQNVHR